MITTELAIPGDAFTISCARGTKADVPEELQRLTEREQAKVLALLNQVAATGPPHNVQKCRKCQSVDGIFELKAGSIRIPFFYRPGGMIVLTHLFIKPGDREQQHEIVYAAGVRDQLVE